MENSHARDLSLLITELMNCQYFARQLENHLDSHLNQPCPTFPACKTIVQSILDSVDKSISMARSSNMAGQQNMANAPAVGTGSPRSASTSPVSGNSGQAFKDQERREITKKRKALPKWTRQIQVCSGMGPEGPVEDEYCWRKYGQKDILGAEYPRAYYRCTHQKTQGCLATKQVQRSDENPTFFDVIYRGEHTCQQNQLVMTTTTMPIGGEQHHVRDHDLQQSYKTGLRVKTEDLGNQELSFSFPSTPIEEPMTSENNIFSIDNHNFVTGSNSTFSPFISPTTTESNYFPVSTFHTGSFGGTLYPYMSESELAEIISAATSTTNSPLMDLDFRPERLEFNQDLPFPNGHFF